MILNKILDWLGKWFARAQTVALIVILAFFFISIFQNGCDRREIAHLVESVTGLNVENDLLHDHITERDTLLIKKDLTISRLNDSISLSQGRYNRLNGNYRALGRKYQNLAGELLTITGDSSYKFINETAYPFEGVRKYPLNEPQIKGIHLTFLEHKTLELLNHNLTDQINELADQLVLKDTVIETTASKMILMRANRADLEQTVQNKDEEIDIKTDALKKQSRGKRFWQTGALVAIILLGVLAVGS